VRQPIRWLIVIGGLAIYVGLIFALSTAQIRLPVALPGWAALAIAPIVYGLLVVLYVKRVSAARLALATFLLCAVHFGVATLTQALVEPREMFPWSPFLVLLWAPLLLVPLHDVLSPPRTRRDRLRPAAPEVRRPASSVPRPASPRPFWPPPAPRATPDAARAVERTEAAPAPRSAGERAGSSGPAQPAVVPQPVAAAAAVGTAAPAVDRHVAAAPAAAEAAPVPAPVADVIENPPPPPRPPTAQPHEIAAARRAAPLLAPLVPLSLEPEVIDGVTVFTASSPASTRDRSTAVARLMLPVLRDRRAPWPVEQLTLRGPVTTVVLTPMGLPATRGPVLLAELPQRGSLALLEILCRRAAVGYEAGAQESRGDADMHGGRDGAGLVQVDVTAHLRHVASSLGAVGPVTASALRDAEAERTLYLFLPAGVDARVIGGFAAHLSRAARAAADLGLAFHSAVLRAGRQRMLVRLPRGGTSRGSLIVAAGNTDRPGLAYRQVEAAAARL